MLPMTVTALTILVAQLEHGPRFRNHRLALPVPRMSFFAAKAATVVLLAADPERAQPALGVSLAGGLIAMAAMLVDLSRREIV